MKKQLGGLCLWLSGFCMGYAAAYWTSDAGLLEIAKVYHKVWKVTNPTPTGVNTEARNPAGNPHPGPTRRGHYSATELRVDDPPGFP